MMEFMAIMSLCLVAILAALAVLSDVVKDNLIERIGLAAICITALGRAAVLHMDGATPVSALLLFIALAVYGLGSAWEKFKLCRARHKDMRGPEQLPESFRTASGRCERT